MSFWDRFEYLILGIAFLVGALWLSTFLGCAKSYPIVCMEDAIVCSLVAHREKVPYRLAVEPGKHVQAQWLIDGEWVSMHERDDMIQESRVDNFKPTKFYDDVRDYIAVRYR